MMINTNTLIWIVVGLANDRFFPRGLKCFRSANKLAIELKKSRTEHGYHSLSFSWIIPPSSGHGPGSGTMSAWSFSAEWWGDIFAVVELAHYQFQMPGS